MITNVQRHAVRPVARRLSAFTRQEDGTIVPLMLVFLLIMLVTGGIAVDVMRFEQKRVAVQNTLDRATLAAASMTQSLDPESVVNDYFTRSGLDSNLQDVVVRRGANYRIVDAKATVLSYNYFMQLLDQPSLAALNVSQAEQRITNVEIALVLDVSGSMYNTPSRITNLKSAAKEFIDTVLENDTENKISISLVPYNGHVNLGPQLFAKYSATQQHNYPDSYCLDLPEGNSPFSSTAISRTTALSQVPFIDTWSSTTQSTAYTAIQGPTWDNGRGLYSNVWCNPEAGNYVRLHSNNRTVLKGYIDGLVAIGATSIDLGLKWGVALLDPGSRSIVTEMVGAGQIQSHFAGRPAAFGDTETMKIIVLMTDGENFEQERVADAYRAGVSDIWQANGTNGNMSIFHSSKVNSSNSTNLCNSRPYWVPHLGAWHSRPWNGTSPSSSACYSTTASTSNVSRLDWSAVWAKARTSWVAWQLYARALGTTSGTRTSTYNSWMATFRSYTPTSTMDARLDQICETSKSRGVTIYGIAFEAPDGGKSAIRNCVSTPLSTYYFDVSGLEIKTAFAAIASNLSQLRLTQ